MSGRYLLRRSGLILYTLLVVSVLVFGITQVLPADAATMLLGENATPDQLAAIRLRLGLNDADLDAVPAVARRAAAGRFRHLHAQRPAGAAADPRGAVAVAAPGGAVHRA